MFEEKDNKKTKIMMTLKFVKKSEEKNNKESYLISLDYLFISHKNSPIIKLFSKYDRFSSE